MRDSPPDSSLLDEARELRSCSYACETEATFIRTHAARSVSFCVDFFASGVAGDVKPPFYGQWSRTEDYPETEADDLDSFADTLRDRANALEREYHQQSSDFDEYKDDQKKKAEQNANAGVS